MTSETPKGSVRKCTIRKWPDFQGYGFNLHSEKSRSGQYIGTVDKASPAETAGIKEGDQIIEVGGVIVGKETHAQVVKRIKASGSSVTLLVADAAAQAHYKSIGVKITGSLEHITLLECASTRPSADPSGEASDKGDADDADVANGNVAAEELNDEAQVTEALNSLEITDEQINGGPSDLPEAAPVREATPPPREDTPPPREDTPPPREPTPPPADVTPAPSDATPSPAEPAEPKMSAKEMREMLKTKKKADPRQEKMSVKAKLDMFQRL